MGLRQPLPIKPHRHITGLGQTQKQGNTKEHAQTASERHQPPCRLSEDVSRVNLQMTKEGLN